MSTSDSEDESLANFLESEILSEESVDAAEPEAKRQRSGGEEEQEEREGDGRSSGKDAVSLRLDTGILSKIPPELFPNILKFLSSEDLMACSMVCKSLNYAASDESLWRRLYRIRWGLLPPTNKIRQCAWKKLYIQNEWI